jgi:uncharacterized membrane protein
MNDVYLARVVHVLAVIMWIGGVAFVTLILLPALRTQIAPAARAELFERIERGFARQARGMTALTALSGLWLVHRLQARQRFLDPHYWWMHAMLALWLVFTLMLCVVEPWFLHAWFRARAARDAEGTFALVLRLHRVLLALSLITVAGAAAGSHGFMF